MIRLLQPQALIALASLLLPVAIHFMRRADRTVLEFAALRFLSERRHPRREWQLRERLLLALRLSLLAALCLLLAGPVWRGIQNTHAHWLAVAPGVDPQATDAVSTLPASARHSLAPSTAVATLASQIRELDAQLPLDTPLDVIVPEELGGLDAERLRLTHAVRWQIVPGRSAAAAGTAARPIATPLAIAVRADEAGKEELPVARALLSAWSAAGAQTSLDMAPVDTNTLLAPLPEQTRWLLWLGGPLSADATDWVKRGGRALVTRDPSPLGAGVLSDDRGMVMFRERHVGRGQVLSTLQPLTVAAMPGLREATMPDRLQSLMAAPLVSPDRAHASDVTPLRSDPTITTASAGSRLTEYVAALAALLYFVERLWATRTARAGIR